MLRVCYSVTLALLMAAQASARDSVALNMWVPFPQSDFVSNESAANFRSALARSTGLVVQVRAFRNLAHLLALCHVGEVDHSILDESQAQALMRECEFELLAESELPLRAYRLRSASAVIRLQRLGIVARSGTSRAALAQWEIPSAAIREYSSSAALLSALYGGHVDAAVLAERAVQLLAPELRSRLQSVPGFSASMRVFVVASMQLDAGLRRQLRDFYLENAAVADWFERDFGVGRLRPPVLLQP